MCVDVDEFVDVFEDKVDVVQVGFEVGELVVDEVVFEVDFD